jgi:hypothetical protein
MQAELDQPARVKRRGDLAEVCRVDVLIYAKERRVIKKVRSLCAEQQRLAFLETGLLREREIQIRN